MFKVNWDESVCSHSAICVNSLPSVFAIENGRFVIHANGATESQIREVCDACPSGALKVAEELG